MTFGERLQKYFYLDLGLRNQREITRRFPNISYWQLSRWLKAEKPSPTLLSLIKEGDENAPIEWLAGDNFMIVEEPKEVYQAKPEQIISEIEFKLKQLKKILAQK